MFQDANDCGLGVFHFRFSGLPPMGLFEEEESRVAQERPRRLRRNPSSSPVQTDAEPPFTVLLESCA